VHQADLTCLTPRRNSFPLRKKCSLTPRIDPVFFITPLPSWHAVFYEPRCHPSDKSDSLLSPAVFLFELRPNGRPRPSLLLVVPGCPSSSGFYYRSPPLSFPLLARPFGTSSDRRSFNLRFTVHYPPSADTSTRVSHWRRVSPLLFFLLLRGSASPPLPLLLFLTSPPRKNLDPTIVPLNTSIEESVFLL